MGMDIFTGYINKNTMVHTFRAPACVIYRKTDVGDHRFTPVITPLKEMLKDARLGLNHLLHVK